MSVHIKVSCLPFTAPTIIEPDDNCSEPAVLVDNGSKLKGFSWSLKAICKGSIVPVLAVPEVFNLSAPNTIKCLSFSEVKTCRALVGTKLAPLLFFNSTALTVAK